MSYHFDLLREPWIPVVDDTGQTRLAGLLETIQSAHTLQAISDASPLVEYGLHRLLCVFLMDALRPEETDDIENLLDEGKFDMQKIFDYVELCRSEGVSFDLFDEKRPFLQTPFSKEWDKDPKPVSYLDCTIPTGNNHVHFDHLEQDSFMSYAEAAKWLPVCSLFITAGAQGYPSSPNGAPPFFSVIRGNSLFQTLAYTLVPVNEIEDFDSIGVYWRSDIPVEPKKKVAKTSWLYGMLFPARRVLLIPEKDGIEKIFYSQGMNFCEPGNWTDPHVTYRYGKEGRFPWRPNGERAVWRNLNDLVNISEKHAPKIFDVYERICGYDSEKMRVCLYGVQTSNASYLDLFYHDLQIPAGLLKDGRALFVGQCISMAEELARRLAYSVNCTGLPEGTGAEASQACYQLCETALWDLCGKELSAERIDGAAIAARWKLQLYSIGRTVSRQILDRLNLTGREWIEIYQKQEALNKYLLELKKEGDLTNGRTE